MCMMMGLLVMALLMCLRRFVMMFRGLLVMFGRLGVMFLQGARHIVLHLCPQRQPHATIRAAGDKRMMRPLPYTAPSIYRIGKGTRRTV
jgi:hypothetical protein